MTGPQYLFGQSGYFRGPVFHNITVDDGLAHRTANTIVQDQEGYIWIGTNNGLNRYDGQKMKAYQWDITDEYSLPSSRIQKLFVSKNGRLWIISENGDLYWYESDHDRFIVVDLNDKETKTSHKVRDIAEDIDGNIWMAASNNEIYKTNFNQVDFEMLDLGPMIHKSEPKPVINKIIIDRQNRLWAGTVNDGIHLFTIREDGIYYKQHFFEGHTNLKLVRKDSDHTIWLCDRYKIYQVSTQSDNPEIEEFCDLKKIVPEIEGEIFTISKDNNDQIWVGVYGSGLLQLKKIKGEFISKYYPGKPGAQEGLTNNHITDLFIDRYNVLWIGSQAGVFWNHLNQKSFYKISKTGATKESLINNIVHAIYRDKYLWVGTRNGLSVIDTVTNRFYNYEKLSKNQSAQDEGGISCLTKDAKGRIWIGTDRGGLFKVMNADDPAKLTFFPIDNLPSQSITDIVEDEWGRIWVGTTTDGLFFLATDQKEEADFYSFNKVQGLNIRALTNLYKDPYENTIWVGTWGNGLARITITSRDSYNIDYFQHKKNNASSLSFNRVNPLVKTDRQTLWAGTIGGGLNKLFFDTKDSVRYSHFTIHDGLPDNTIHTIQKDDSGKLWLGGTGLTRFDPETEKITYFDTNDGLQSNLFIINADFKDQLGRLYFGGPYGLNFFKPDEIHKEESYPDVIISGMEILNKEIKVGEQINGRILLSQVIHQLKAITIKEKENDLTLDFQVIHTAMPSKNHLKYRMFGYQEGWIEVEEAQASVTYSNLRSGNYIFQIMGSNGDGIWNPKMTSLSIKIRPYWYKTNLAYGCYILLFLLLLWLFRRAILIQSNLRNNLKIAQIEIEKDRELAEMKMRFFNNITHELRTPLTLIKGPIEELLTSESLTNNIKISYYHTIQQNANKLFRLVNRLLDFRKAESGHFQLEAAEGDFVSFAKEIYLSFQQLAKDKKIQYTFEAEHTTLPLFYDWEKMEIVLCNLLSNAFKYSSQDDEIKLLIRQEEKYCILEVSDSGKGMSPEEVGNIFNRFYQIAKSESFDIIGTGIGLSMVKNIVDLHQGEIAVQTHPGQGSIFTLRLPTGRSHLTDDQIIPDSGHREHDPSGQKTDTFPAVRLEESDQLKNLLIVEDNPEIRAFIKSIFSEHFVVQEAAHGLEGLAALERSTPDIIISDIMMDHMDGIAFCNKVKEDPDLVHIPFILLTSRTSNVYKVDGFSSGADAYITKPFNGQVLIAQVNSLLKTRTLLKDYYTARITLGPKKIEITSEEVLFLEELIAIIEEKLEEENLTAESLSSTMGMSHSSLYRKVKSYTGESINSFIRSIRLKQAAQLFADSELNISQVAYKVGFSDVNYFGKCFKLQFSMSPTAYIKALVGNEKTDE